MFCSAAAPRHHEKSGYKFHSSCNWTNTVLASATPTFSAAAGMSWRRRVLSSCYHDMWHWRQLAPTPQTAWWREVHPVEVQTRRFKTLTGSGVSERGRRSESRLLVHLKRIPLVEAESSLTSDLQSPAGTAFALELLNCYLESLVLVLVPCS